ncbi:LysM peptidoglycan-binding domain-containing protein [Fulvivirga sediminis]|uniref:LysM peptidoglycan-binding domain-containing protein n=1 Tax=Fulvivirga sediminis TaxID=2803949 RepID=A0A937FBF4_9BACT|nr:LysM peptidoglycan-binding domain-containing protein [Fulvivirga sediminis]MBL3658891.1 LysM peptidoglycan-binding domain-containing protein [Fulvivirga sediminis]
MPRISFREFPDVSLETPALNILRPVITKAYFAEATIEEVVIESTTETEAEVYTVVSGDTLSKIANKKGTTVAAIIESDSALTDQNKGNLSIGQQITLPNQVATSEKKKKISFSKVDSGNIGKELYVVVETTNFSGYQVKLNVRQGKEKCLEEEGQPLSVKKEDGNYGHLITSTVGAMCDSEYLNKDEFSDMAIAKISIDTDDEDKLEAWREALDCAEDKKTSLCLLVDAHTVEGQEDMNISYKGNTEEGEVRGEKVPNVWLDVDGEWFVLNNESCCTRNITKAQIKNIAIYATDENISNHLNGINQSFVDNDINTCLRRVHYLAQLIHESGSLRYTEELGASESDYGGFKGRGLIQLTFKSNYEDYGEFVSEDFSSTQENKEKLEVDPHAARSAGWYWGQKAELNDEADNNDFIYITFAINGGYNGYNDRLEWVEKGFDELYNSCDSVNEDYNTNYVLEDSKAYNNQKAVFGWGLWHDPGLSKAGCTKDKDKAIVGYERFIDLHDSAGKPELSNKWYGYDGSVIRSTILSRLSILKNEEANNES